MIARFSSGRIVPAYRAARRRFLAGVAAVGWLPAAAPRAQQIALTVFAASSLKTALDRVAGEFRAARGAPVSVSYAASSSLARQIEQGAPADVFVSADADWMDYLEQRKLLRPGTRHDLLGNTLVLVAPAGDPVAVALRPGLDLAAVLGTGRLALADVRSVPAGKYARAALERLGAWSGVERRLAMAENVRVALALVARGEARLGIVYGTDAHAEPGVRVVGTFPADSHPPIVYPVALVESSRHPLAEAFVSDLRSPAARKVFQGEGFSLLAR